MRFQFAQSISQSLRKIWPFSKRNRANSSDAPMISPEAWLSSLVRERGKVMNFSDTISKEFTQHSMTLESLIDDIEALKKSCQSVIEIISDDQDEAPVQFSYQLFKKSEDIIKASFEQFRTIFESVKVLRAQIQNVESNQTKLSKLTVPLQMITVQYRITASIMDEATRLEFYDLADKLTSLVTDINKNINQQFQDLSATSTICTTIISDLEKMVADYESQIGEQLGTSRHSLDNLGQSLEASHGLIRQISNCSERLSEGIFSIMVSMQAQDMTSQKLEHICNAVDSITERLQHGEHGDKASLYFAREASRIQKNQLSHLFRELENATESIRHTTLNTESEIENIANATTELSEIGSQKELLKDSAESVQRILSFVESTVDKTKDVLLALAPLRAKFTNSTSKVMKIAAEMKMVAINAQVYATNVNNGEALEVLSHSTQTQSTDAKDAIEAISISLEQVAESLNDTEKKLSEFSKLGQMDMDQLLEESEIAQEELRRLEKDLPAKLNSIQNKRETVTRKTQKFANDVNMGADLKALADEILDVFERISNAPIGNIDESLARREQAKISSLRDNYTMKSESITHDESMGLDSSQSTYSKHFDDSASFESFDDFSHPPPEPSEPDSSEILFEEFDQAPEDIAEREQERVENQTKKNKRRPEEDDNIELF